MGIPSLPPWTYDPVQAIHIQDAMRQRLILDWDNRDIARVGGIDFSFTGGTVFAAIAIFAYPSLELIEQVSGDAPAVFPYISGLLTFRVAPAILAAWEKLRHKPDLVMVHGHGIAHPRRMGLASQLGLRLDLPAIGIARTRLYGRETEAGPNKGDWSELLDEKSPHQVIGAVLRTRPACRPVYVSPGHLVDLQHSVDIVLSCCSTYRIPIPLRMAHKLSAEQRPPMQLNRETSMSI